VSKRENSCLLVLVLPYSQFCVLHIFSFLCSNISFNIYRIVVDINGHTVTYDKFYDSLKARGDICDEVMVAHVELFNERIDQKSSYFTVGFISFLFLFVHVF
jgi:hypothetical protein